MGEERRSERDIERGPGEPMTAGGGSTVPALVAAWTAATPEAPAVRSASATLTYGQLGAAATALAARLRALGAGPDAVVALLLDRSAAMVAAALGVLTSGAAYLPLDPGYPDERLAFMLSDAAPAAIVTTAALAPRLPAGNVPVIVLDDDALAGDPQESAPALDDLRAEHLAYVIYTSGSTGRPKGVEITHAGLRNLVAWHRRAFALTPADRATLLSSPAFDAAVWELWPYLAAGASVHVGDDAIRVDPAALRDWLVREGITVSFVPTPLAERLIALDWPARPDLRVLLTGADTLHHFPRAGLPFALVNNYGPTENTVVTTSGVVPPDQQLDTLPTIGRAIENVEVHVLDERLVPVPPGVPGELYIGGIGLARGYRGRPDLTAERFVPCPWRPGARLYRSGDRARWLPDGQVAFLGRADEQIKIRGFRIEPDEIAAILDLHPGVHSSVVVATNDGAGERRLVAYVVTSPTSPPTRSELVAALTTRLPDYMVPATFVTLPALPLTENGKVDRGALPAPTIENTLVDGAYVAPRTPVEERLAAIMAELLAVENVGASDNFFLLGGHSLLGTQVVSRVRDVFDVELPLRRVFDTPTVAALSAEIEQLIFAKLEAETSDSPEPRAA